MASCILFLATAFLLSLSMAYAEDPVYYDYDGKTSGPKKWGTLCPQYLRCSVGKHQSPVNIVKDEVVLNKNLSPLKKDYYSLNANLVNNGHSIAMEWTGESPGVLILDGKNYSLTQLHWHTPSEHLINGVRYAAELHLVHHAADGSAAVVATLYHYGVPDPFVLKIKRSLTELAKKVYRSNELDQIHLGKLETESLKKNNRKYYRYIGSLTTPPCTENVTWSVLDKVRSISKEQVAELKAPLGSHFKDNARPIQPLDGRKIELFDEDVE